MIQLQDSISKHLHHDTLSSMPSDEIYEAHHARILSCYGPRVNVWLTTWPIFLAFRLSSLIFSTTLRKQLRLPHPSIVSVFQCVCTHPINPMGIHLLHCVHGNECIKTHDAICLTFAFIAQDVSFHVGWEQLHALPSPTFNSSCQQINIVFTKNDIHTLTDVVIANSTQADLLP